MTEKTSLGKLPGIDDHYFQWKRIAHTEDGIRFLDIEGDELDFSSLMWNSYEDAVKAIEDGNWGYDREDAEDWALVEVNAELHKNPFSGELRGQPLNQTKLFKTYLEEAACKVKTQCEKQCISTNGFKIDYALEDWGEIDTSDVVNTVTEYASLISKAIGDYEGPLRAITEALSDYFSDDYHVEVLVKKDETAGTLHPDDQTICGSYTVRINSYVPQHLLCDAALDIFHANVPITVLDDFDIRVIKGEELEPCEDVEDYTLSNEGEIIEFVAAGQQ